MMWEKKGIVFSPDKSIWWQQKFGMLPTPFYFEKENFLRIFYASACIDNYCRISYVDVDSVNPSIILNKPDSFVLDIGEPGTFDDCGIIPTCVLKIDDLYYLYYSGYQRHIRVPYSILSGIAISKDGKKFSRISSAPFLERTEEEMNIRSAPFIFYEEGKYHMFYTAGNGWRNFSDGLFQGRTMPTYVLKHAVSHDCNHWDFNSEPLFDLGGNEFGISRPYIIKADKQYKLYYSIRSVDKPYTLGCAISENLLQWRRDDNLLDLETSESGWDSQMLCYPSVIEIKGNIYLFYNGNQNGESGFGYAQYK